MMGVNPYAVHLEFLRPPDAWISELPAEIQTALFEDAREPPEWLPEEWSGRLPTRSHAPDEGIFDCPSLLLPPLSVLHLLPLWSPHHPTPAPQTFLFLAVLHPPHPFSCALKLCPFCLSYNFTSLIISLIILDFVVPLCIYVFVISCLPVVCLLFLPLRTLHRCTVNICVCV